MLAELGRGGSKLALKFSSIKLAPGRAVAAGVPVVIGRVAGKPELNGAQATVVGQQPGTSSGKWAVQLATHGSGSEKEGAAAACGGGDTNLLQLTAAEFTPMSKPLPDAHTCFRQLILPAVVIRAEMQEVVDYAVAHCREYGNV